MAINAGNTMLLYVIDRGDNITNIDPNILIDGVVEAVIKGEIEEKNINKSVRKILEIRKNIKTFAL